MREMIRKQLDMSLATQVVLGHLDIQDNELEEIFTFLREQKPDLESIYLDNNKISSTGATFLAEILPAFNKLTFIDLQFNVIGKDGIKVLSQACEKSATKIALYGNEDSNVSHTLSSAAYGRRTR